MISESPRESPRIIGPLLLFAALAMIWSYPLVLRLNTHLPGEGAGDNMSFLWNLWWMREAYASVDLDFFHTTYLFHPFGADLTLHTHTALQGLLAAGPLAGLPLPAAHNTLLLAALTLNGFCAYILAHRVSGHTPGALVAGVIFGGSPYLTAHLLGHFNLTSVWGLPLFAWLLIRAFEGTTRWAAPAAGAALVLLAYGDYYYFVYALLFLGCYLLTRWLPVDSIAVSARTSPAALRTRRVILTLLAIVAALLAAVAVTGGGVWTFGALSVSMRSGFNLRVAAWFLVAMWMACAWRLTLSVNRAKAARVRNDLKTVAGAGVVTAVGISPLLINSLRLLQTGAYTTPVYLWRSAPRGIDLVSLFVPSALHPLLGSAAGFVFSRLGLDIVEQTAWLGIVPIVLVVRARRELVEVREARRWAFFGSVFFVGALGPFLYVFGVNTGLILPQTLVRYVPIVANARMPGRAIVMVYLSLAVLVAISLAARRLRSPGLAGALTLLIVLEYAAFPFPLYELEQPSLYSRLADLPEAGAVLEIPFGVRDGFGGRGYLDHRVLYYQTLHGRPLLGGFVARLPEATTNGYVQAPVIGSLLRLSEGSEVSEGDIQQDKLDAPAIMERMGIGYVVVNRAEASDALSAYIEDVLPLTPIAEDGDRVLYAVTPVRP